MLLPHTLVIERSTAGAVDTWNQPSYSYADLATVPGLVDPKSALEVAQANQAGAVVGDYTIYVHSTVDLTEADRIRYGGREYEILGIRPYVPGLNLDHLEADARLVRA